MLNSRKLINKTSKDEAEKPFWISFADLMTALMVLFLVVMGVALLAVTKTVTEQEKRQEQHRENIAEIIRRFEKAAEKYDGIEINKERQVINFGQRAQFAFGDWRLNSQQEDVLRRFVPEILTIANDDLGRSVLKRIVIEGYTDRTGSYLSNLNLSLQRSQKVLCSLFSTSGSSLLDDIQKEQVRTLFFVGGYSFNAAKDTPEESRRVEMRLEFLGVDETRGNAPTSSADFGTCALR
ncbi:MAG: flagellar motor protein MotB [Limnobacter sp.]|uniref:OmpA/MotB family protein n=1 Tax=Limnobacter sp. TaxID=2003368 RepID=UPI00121AEBD3|nr:OmpA family protein [Limnobacter sp.]RZO91448.1 MAG: flagellar motor protein MotB [Limnobacter sp.]